MAALENNIILPDQGITIDNEMVELESINVVESFSVLGDELPYDTEEFSAKEKQFFSIIYPDRELSKIKATGLQYLSLPSYVPSFQPRIEMTFEFDEEVLEETSFQMRLFDFYNLINLTCEKYSNQTIQLNLRFTPGLGVWTTYSHSFENIDSAKGVHTIYIDGEDGTFFLDGILLYDALYISGEETDRIDGTLFSGRVSSGSAVIIPAPLIGEIYSVKVWNASSLCFNLTPYLKDNIAGLADSVTGGFLRSSSGADFLPPETEDSPCEVMVSYSSILSDFQYGARVNHYISNSLFKSLYIESSVRKGKRKYAYSCISLIGLLDRQNYEGGLFQGVSFSTVLRSILGNNISYTVGTAAAAVRIFGWIPYGKKREALQQLLFASNVHVFSDSYGNPVFNFIDFANVGNIPSDRMFEGGSVEHPKLATKISVTEHSFYSLPGTESVVLFDNTSEDPASGTLVIFQQAPIRVDTLVASGTLTFSNATVNSVIVSGSGTLTGKPYVHITRVVSREASSTGREDYEISVQDATLISASNSESVADRVADFWFNRYIVRSDVKISEEKCGKLYEFADNFGDPRYGCLQKIEKSFSSFIRGRCEFLCGISSWSPGGDFQAYSLIVASGVWTVPSGVTRVRLTIIGGGDGASSGLSGKSGSGRNGGTGGGAGSPGAGGKVFITTIPVTPGQDISISVGSKGIGGGVCYSDISWNEGSAGGITSATYSGITYTSDEGSSKANGVTNIFTGIVYALPGGVGASGGDGGNGASGGSCDPSEQKNLTGQAGTGVDFDGSLFSGGSGGTGQSVIAELVTQKFNAGGGGGGGACVGLSGEDGSAGSASKGPVEYLDGTVLEIADTRGGSGGQGMSPGKRTAPETYGSGGHAGHGGGGGGGLGGGTEYSREWGTYPFYVVSCSDQTDMHAYPGQGGFGGPGGDGAAGCVLIYY